MEENYILGLKGEKAKPRETILKTLEFSLSFFGSLFLFFILGILGPYFYLKEPSYIITFVCYLANAPAPIRTEIFGFEAQHSIH